MFSTYILLKAGFSQGRILQDLWITPFTPIIRNTCKSQLYLVKMVKKYRFYFVKACSGDAAAVLFKRLSEGSDGSYVRPCRWRSKRWLDLNHKWRKSHFLLCPQHRSIPFSLLLIILRCCCFLSSVLPIWPRHRDIWQWPDVSELMTNVPVTRIYGSISLQLII